MPRRINIKHQNIVKKSNLFGTSVRNTRTRLGLSQEAIGAQGFISTPGWIKIENGQRSGSEKFIDKYVNWLVKDKHLTRKDALELRSELLAAKYLDSNSEFVRECVKAKLLGDGGLRSRIESLRNLAAEAAQVAKKRGRPAKTARR